jgi:hypothetical protein
LYKKRMRIFLILLFLNHNHCKYATNYS